MYQKSDIVRVPYDDGNRQWTEVYLADPKHSPVQWAYTGLWPQKDLEIVEKTLLAVHPDYLETNHWQLFYGAYGRDYRFVGKRHSWEMGPFVHGDTAEEFARALYECEKGRRRS